MIDLGFRDYSLSRVSAWIRRASALTAITRYATNLTQLTIVLVDGDYSGQSFITAANEKLRVTAKVAKHNELLIFAVIPQRWVVERFFRVTGKMPAFMEELRVQTQYQPSAVHLAFLARL
jgi:transposase